MSRVPGGGPGSLTQLRSASVLWELVRCGVAAVAVLGPLPLTPRVPMPVPGWVATGVVAALLVGLHVLGRVARRGSDRAAYRAAVGLFAGDLVLVLGMLWFFNRSPSHSHWALLAIPVLQAALLGRLAGALAAFAVAAPVLVLRHDVPVSELGFQLAVLLLLSVVAGTQASLLHARISELAALHSELQYRATHDALTGLPARSVLMDRLDDALAAARRDASMVAVLYVDCDRFKEVNDTLGHKVGDRVLVEAALRLRRATRSWDTVARIGGDEFGVVLERLSDVADADLIVERLVTTFREVWCVGGLQLDVRASVGGVCTSGWGQPDRLLAAADALMYDVKRNGGDGRTVVLFDEPRECRCYSPPTEPRSRYVLGLSAP